MLWGGHRSIRGNLSCLEELQTFFLTEGFLERTAIEGESPVDEKCATLSPVPEYDGTREILSESGGTTLQG